ncbi:MAG: hypothetical protein AAAC47_08600 [Pararhizobium sp.]
MATLAAYIGGLCKHPLVRGERGVLLCIAPDQRQAAIVLDYATAAFEQSPILKQLIANRTADTLELTNSINVEVRSAFDPTKRTSLGRIAWELFGLLNLGLRHTV